MLINVVTADTITANTQEKYTNVNHVVLPTMKIVLTCKLTKELAKIVEGFFCGS